MKSRAKQFIVLICGLPLFVYLVLALTELGKASPCAWQFPQWFGCVLDAHEGLAGGLIGAAVTLAAAWVAWSAVQQQMSAERERAMADREEAERLLTDDLMYYAEGMAAAWRLLVAIPEGATPESIRPIREATAYMAERVSRPESIANYRAMVEILGWERRMRFNPLINGLERMRAFAGPTRLLTRTMLSALFVALRMTLNFVSQRPANTLKGCGGDRRRHGVSVIGSNTLRVSAPSLMFETTSELVVASYDASPAGWG
jgi:hypothetical protein